MRSGTVFLGNELGRVEQVEVEVVLSLLLDQLHAELPFGTVAGFDRVPQVAPVEVGVGAHDLLGLVPHQ